jgi:hypothetical protein
MAIIELGVNEICVVSSVMLGFLGPLGTPVQGAFEKRLLEKCALCLVPTFHICYLNFRCFETEMSDFVFLLAFVTAFKTWKPRFG